MKKRVSYAFALAWAMCSNLSLATVDDAERSAARSLGYEGVADYQKGEFTAAADKLERAFSVVRVPTLGLWLARSLVKVGRLVEASERYVEVVRLDVTGSGSQIKVLQKAQAEAIEELEQLNGRIPKIRLVVRAKDPDGVAVTVDGLKVSPALFGAARPINPGMHIVVAEYAGRERTQELRVVEGASREVTLDFEDASTQPEAVQPLDTDQSTPKVTTAIAKPVNPMSWQKKAGWVGVGMGSLGMAVGTTAAILFTAQRSDAKEGECPNYQCPPAAWKTADRIETLRMVSSIGFIAGGILGATGATLLLTAPKSESRAASLSPWVGPGAAGIRGIF